MKNPNIDYRFICDKVLLKDLPSRQGEILIRRFGLKKSEGETLEAIGKDLGVTRERVRQIEQEGLQRLKEKLDQPPIQKAFRYFTQYLKQAGNLKKEEILLWELGDSRFQNQVFFLLTLGKDFERMPESEDFYSLWTIDRNSVDRAKKLVNTFESSLRKRKQLLALPSNIFPAYLEISKRIGRGLWGKYGLKEWPEVNPRGIKDRAYLAIKKEAKPLHFKEVAERIGKDTLFQTVHNELIKDERFVLVGRGTYALKEWGYEPGVVREVILKVLKAAERPLPKEKIVASVLRQRQVKENTILLNLNNKNYFLRDSRGRYTVKV